MNTNKQISKRYLVPVFHFFGFKFSFCLFVSFGGDQTRLGFIGFVYAAFIDFRLGGFGRAARFLAAGRR